MESTRPRTSIIVLSYNGMKHLPECLESIYDQTDTDFELIVVDNASRDGSPQWVTNHYPTARLIKLCRNQGFCRGMNRGVAEAVGEYLFLLNQDIVLDTECLGNLAGEMESRSKTWIGAFPKVVFYDAPEFINAFGVRWYETCHWRDTRVGLADFGQYKTPEQVFGSIFPAVLLRRDRFNEIGRFDPLFWSYNEDFDLCYRAALFGYKFVAVPASVIRHKYRASSRDLSDPLWSRYWFVRNYFLVFLKNYQLKNLLKYRRIIFMRYMGFSMKEAWKTGRFKEVLVYGKIIVSLVFRVPWILKRRFFIQLHRKISDREIWSYGTVEEHNIYHYNGCIVLSLKSFRAAVIGEKYPYTIGDVTYSSI
ncbi:glycosyltransferase family 2 protein [bacterium]|nr:glycosyltransferase family 2 protein [candidate division CSSED10-310 bacterium]